MVKNKINKQNLQILRQTAAYILAKAISDLYPKSKILKFEVLDFGFFCDIALDISPSKELLLQITERMESIIREDREIFVKEMLPKVAFEYFKHLGKSSLAKNIDHQKESLIKFVEMDDFIELSNEEYLQKSSMLRFFQLLEAEEISKGKIRIIGSANSSKDELKKLVKRYHTYQKNNHMEIGKKLGFFTQNEQKEWIWLEKGLLAQEQLINYLKKELKKEKFSYVRVPTKENFEDKISYYSDLAKSKDFNNKFFEIFSCRSEKKKSFDNGLLDPKEYTTSLEVIFTTLKEAENLAISSLHFINKILIILGFSYRIVVCNLDSKKQPKKVLELFEKALKKAKLSYEIEEGEGGFEGPYLLFEIEDFFGRSWKSSFFGMRALFDKEKKSYNRASFVDGICIVRSTFGKIERFLALLLEKQVRDFPSEFFFRLERR